MDQVCKEYINITPIEFYQKKLNREANLNELLIIEYINDHFDFPNDVTNLLIDQILKLNNFRLTRGFAIKLANQWHEKQLKTMEIATQHAKHEYEKFLQLQVRDNFGELRDLTLKEKEIVNRIFYKSTLEEAVLDEALSYCMKINDGYIISWFLNRVVEYLENHNVKDKNEAHTILNIFHQKFVLNFGNEKSSVFSN